MQASDIAKPHTTTGATGHPMEIGMLIYPGMTALDMVAPQLVFANLPNSRVHLVWKTLEPVVCDTGLAILPTCTLEECPANLDVLFVGGSKASTWALMNDQHITGFLSDRGSRAKWITSVCTGSLLLAAAGLLKGYSATSHWAVRHLLAALGANPVEERVVQHGNRLTGGGVTAGIDFALLIASKLCGEDFAKTFQLLIEYDPQPPFQCGSPALAEPEIVHAANARYAGEVARASLEVEQCLIGL
jgi:cyclohexyl-isocyanide hydratase